jgi:hypothetical protein
MAEWGSRGGVSMRFGGRTSSSKMLGKEHWPGRQRRQPGGALAGLAALWPSDCSTLQQVSSSCASGTSISPNLYFQAQIGIFDTPTCLPTSSA